MVETVDVIVIGAGPSGLSAAAAAAARGLSVLLLDEQAEPGGQIWRNAARWAATPGANSSLLRRNYGDAATAIAAMRRSGVRYVSGATVFDVSRDLEVSWIDREKDGAEPATHRIVETAARALIVATGAMERPLPFPGWTLPGVMGVGALQTALKVGRLVPGNGNLVVAGQGPLVLLYLAQLEAMGGRAAAVLDLGPPRRLSRAAGRFPAAVLGDPGLLAQGLGLLARRLFSKTRVYGAVKRLQAVGDRELEAVTFESGGVPHRLPCTILAAHDGVIPATQMSRLLELDHGWREDCQTFEPESDPFGHSTREGVWVVGDGAGIEGAALAALRGELAALDVAHRLEKISGPELETAAAPLLARRARRKRARTFVDALYPPVPLENHVTGDTEICRCESVTAGDIRNAVACGATAPNRVKTFTRCGMGPCQGRMCGPTLVRLLAAETGVPPAEQGSLRIRPPLKPILLGDYVEAEPDADDRRPAIPETDQPGSRTKAR